jgi:hypothetical protein
MMFRECVYNVQLFMCGGEVFMFKVVISNFVCMN